MEDNKSSGCSNQLMKSFQYTKDSKANSAMIYTNATLAPIANIGNILVLAAFIKTRSLHSSSNTFLCCLAITDMLVGCIAHPLNALTKGPFQGSCNVRLVALAVDAVLAGVSFLTVVAISVDRWLALHLHLRYLELVTVGRVYKVYACTWVVVITFLVISITAESDAITETTIIVVVLFIEAAGLFVICLSYFKISRIVRRHQNQILDQIMVFAGTDRQSVSHVLRHKNSALNALWVLLLFLLCDIPFLCVTVARLFQGDQLDHLASQVTGILFLGNSSLNPVVYCIRIPELRRAVNKILRCHN